MLFGPGLSKPPTPLKRRTRSRPLPSRPVSALKLLSLRTVPPSSPLTFPVWTFSSLSSPDMTNPSQRLKRPVVTSRGFVHRLSFSDRRSTLSSSRPFSRISTRRGLGGGTPLSFLSPPSLDSDRSGFVPGRVITTSIRPGHRFRAKTVYWFFTFLVEVGNQLRRPSIRSGVVMFWGTTRGET